MFEISKINFIRARLAILDENQEEPIISNYDVDKDDDISTTFIEKTIINLFSSMDMKWGRFNPSYQSKLDSITEELGKNLSNFMPLSKEIIDIYFEAVKENLAVSSGQLIIVLFEMDEVPYLGVFKYNHKNMFTTVVENINDSKNIMIARKNSMFVTSRHKCDEGFVLHLYHRDFAMIDKAYEINEERQFILKDIVLNCDSKYSQKEKLKIFNQITKNIEDNYVGSDLDKRAQIKKVVKDSVLEYGTIDVDQVSKKAFEESSQITDIYRENLANAGLDMGEKIEVSKRTLDTKFQKQKLLTESGISIDIPIEYYDNPDMIEFVPNSDNTINLVIKNIKNITT